MPNEAAAAPAFTVPAAGDADEEESSSVNVTSSSSDPASSNTRAPLLNSSRGIGSRWSNGCFLFHNLPIQPQERGQEEATRHLQSPHWVQGARTVLDAIVMAKQPWASVEIESDRLARG